MPRIVGIELPSKRLPQVVEVSKDLTRYDLDNCYPERVERLISASGTASAATSIYQDFLLGEGFVDDSINEIVINRWGDTMFDLLEQIAHDMAWFNNFSFRIDWNLLFEISALTYVDAKFCRFGVPNSAGYISNIYVHNNWEQDYHKTRDPNKKPTKYYRFNPIDKVIFEQIKADGGIRNYKGQIFYWTPKRQSYSKCPLDAVLEDVETDAQAKWFKNTGIKTNFMAGHIFKDPTNYEGGDTEEAGDDEKAMGDALKKFQGAENTMKLLWMKNFPPDLLEKKINLLEKVDIQDIDRLYQYTEESVKSNIIDHLKIPQVLFSKYDGNSLGQGSEIYKEASQQFNLVTRNTRMKITRALEKIAQYYPVLRDKDLSIKELYADDMPQTPETVTPANPEPEPKENEPDNQ